MKYLCLINIFWEGYVNIRFPLTQNSINSIADGYITWSCSILDLDFSAFFLWMNSMRTRLFYNNTIIYTKGLGKFG